MGLCPTGVDTDRPLTVTIDPTHCLPAQSRQRDMIRYLALAHSVFSRSVDPLPCSTGEKEGSRKRWRVGRLLGGVCGMFRTPK